jgi:hypothetical protein
MEGFSIWYWLIVVIVVGIFVVLPAWMTVRILSKAGRSSLWCLVMLVPLVNIVMVWVFAFARWPALEVAGAAAPSPTGPSVGAGESGGRGGQASAATPSRPESKGPTTPDI